MTKKDYVILASVISQVHDTGEADIATLRAVAGVLCIRLKQANDTFNKDKFLEACGLGW